MYISKHTNSWSTGWTKTLLINTVNNINKYSFLIYELENCTNTCYQTVNQISECHGELIQ